MGHAQEPPVDPVNDGFTPPVHIPPRIPRFDPGLPETLNGKFNSTQMIRSNARTGLRSVISDLTVPTQTGIFSSRTRTQDQATRVRTPNQSALVAPKRRKGIQDRISEMLASGSKTKSQHAPVRVENWTGAHQQARQIPRSPATDYRMQPVPRTARTASASRMMNRSPVGNENQMTQHSMTPNQRLPQKRLIQNSRVAPPMTRPVQNRDNTIQQVGLRQADGQDNSFIANAQGQFAPQTANDPAPDPKQAAIQFRQSMLNKKTQTQLPDLQQRPVSVLNNRSDDEITLEPLDDSFEEPMDLRTESPFEELDGYSSPASPSNSLRAIESTFSFQDEDEEQTEDATDLSMDDSENPLRRSCEDFRKQLLNDPLIDISLDISPPGNPDLFGENTVRVWRDQSGNELVRGSIADLRRGYVIIDSAAGGQVRVPYARLSDNDWLAISAYWRLPVECGLGAGNYVARCWVPQTVTWQASALCHKPLYFENRQLERYGHTHGPFLQPVASTAHFFSSLFFLPYNTAINPPNECQYALGFYRPGNCAPWLKDPFPISLAGATRQATVWAGIGLLAD